MSDTLITLTNRIEFFDDTRLWATDATCSQKTFKLYLYAFIGCVRSLTEETSDSDKTILTLRFIVKVSIHSSYLNKLLCQNTHTLKKLLSQWYQQLSKTMLSGALPQKAYGISLSGSLYCNTYTSLRPHAYGLKTHSHIPKNFAYKGPLLSAPANFANDPFWQLPAEVIQKGILPYLCGNLYTLNVLAQSSKWLRANILSFTERLMRENFSFQKHYIKHFLPTSPVFFKNIFLNHFLPKPQTSALHAPSILSIAKAITHGGRFKNNPQMNQKGNIVFQKCHLNAQSYYKKVDPYLNPSSKNALYLTLATSPKLKKGLTRLAYTQASHSISNQWMLARNYFESNRFDIDSPKFKKANFLYFQVLSKAALAGVEEAITLKELILTNTPHPEITIPKAFRPFLLAASPLR